MATSHKISDILLGQVGGSEFGIIGNPLEFSSWFRQKYGYYVNKPVAYVKASYNGGHSNHKLARLVPGYLVLTGYGIIFFAKFPEKFIIPIPFGAIDYDLMFVESNGFKRLALTTRNREKFLKTLESTDISRESKKILSDLPEEAAALARQRVNKSDINAFVETSINIAVIIKKKTMQIPYADAWGLQKPKFFLGITSPGLNEFIYAWARLKLQK
ncbi:MAG TPA: hypothetical protein VJ110_01685 [Candidatus Nanoarchaeia archaeon]|nr:hypothetical protein [Candidatus Nanoarchaeia archaeon]